MSPDKLGKYEIRRELGRGAMGVVYEAYDPMIKRIVALKTIRADQLAREDAAVVLARFRREAQAAGRLNHPNIVSIYDFDEDAGTSFIAMERVTGRDLREVFDAGERFRASDIVRIMGQILDALDYSHRNGVIHRDVKPANVFLQPDGSVKVADFGIAHVDSSSLTQDGSVLGTPSYMSPEQILGLPVDGRSDLFSAGVILYQFLTGERPFAGSSTTIMQKVLKEDPLPPSTLNVQLPDAVDTVVRKALAKRPEERYQTAAEFAAALQRVAGVPAGIAGLAAGGVAGAGAAAASDPMATEVSVPGRTAPPREMVDNATIVGSAAPAAASMSSAASASSSVPPPAPSYRPGVPAQASPGRSQASAIAVVIGVAFVAVALGVWVFVTYGPGRTGTPVVASTGSTTPGRAGVPAPASPAPTAAAKTTPAVADAAPPSAAPAPPPAPPAAMAAPVADATKPASPSTAREPGSVLIAAQGYVDPSDPRYQGNASLLQSDLRADAKAQLVEKALGLLVDRASLAKNYDKLSEKLLANSAGYIGTVVRESEPRTGKDGLVSMTTEAVVDVKAVQKSLNQMSRDERIVLIRANGNPRIAMRVSVRDADRSDAPPRPSPIAENLLKERVKAFGFRTWSEGGEPGRAGDFVVSADARIRRLSTRLEASGITVTKYAVTALTVKCVDQATGEELYFKTVLPKGTGSWATEEDALKAVGERIADEFSRDFFLQHVYVTGQRVALVVNGLPDATIAELVGRELVGLPSVIAAKVRGGADPAAWELSMAGSGTAGDLVANGIVAPLNTKLGRACFSPGAVNGDEVRITFDKGCNEPSVIARLEALPPAGLFGAPPSRQKSVIKNPDTLRKLSV